MKLARDVHRDDEPTTQLAHVVAAALDRIKEAAVERGIELDRVVIAARRVGDEEERNAETVFEGFDEDNPAEMLSFFIAHAQAVAEAYGITLQIHKVNRG